MPQENNQNNLITSEKLHNQNCGAYLKFLADKIPGFILDRIANIDQNLAANLRKIRLEKEYNPDFAYSDIYKNFFEVLEEHNNYIILESRMELILRKKRHFENEGLKNFSETHRLTHGYSDLAKSIATIPQQITEDLKSVDKFVHALYANDNEILEQTFEVVKQIPLGANPSAVAIEKGISELLKDKGDKVNNDSQTPAEAGSGWGRFVSTWISSDFKPQHTTSLATVRKFDFKTNEDPIEYRFGTQGQRHDGDARVSPLFERWLEVQQRLHSPTPESPITHVYINNLGFDRTDPFDFEGKKERELSDALHGLEERHSNLAVITLPADKGIMSGSAFKDTEEKHGFQSVYDEFLQITRQREGKNDFYISPKIRALLFKNDQGIYNNATEEKCLRELLNESFAALGLNKANNPQLSSAQRQALWFHFNKFTLPKHINDTLQPKSINFSCKDAIDRGGVSSAYYNLIKSIEKGNPLSREEFEKTLHAAPAMVKARGMNHHLKMIWNAVDTYVNSNYDAIQNDNEAKQAWLIEWRDLNCPHPRVPQLLTERIAKVLDELNEIKANTNDPDKIVRVNKALKIVNSIKEQNDIGVSGKRLLLETVVLTPKLVEDPTNAKNIERYEALSDELKINYGGVGKVLAGLMKSFAGWLIAKFSSSLLEKGLATLNAGLEIDKRREVISEMKDQLLNLHASQQVNEGLNNEQEPTLRTVSVP